MAENTDNLSLEKLVREVDYRSLERGYVPSNFALEFINFIKLVCGGKEENLSPLFHFKMLDNIQRYMYNLIVSFRGSAKALALDTPVMTPYGHVPLEHIHVGDFVIDRNGKSTKVVKESEIFSNQMYRITLDTGEFFDANEDHQHIVHYRTTTSNGNTKDNKWKEVVLTTKEIISKGVVYTREKSYRNPKGYETKWAIPLISNPIEFTTESYEIDPYFVGVVLGDGTLHKDTSGITIASNKEDAEEIVTYIPYEYTSINSYPSRTENATTITYSNIGMLYRRLVGEHVREQKCIPHNLLYGSIKDRYALLQGLMDTDGTITKTGLCSFCNISPALAYGVHHIVKSLGGNSKVVYHDNAYKGYYLVHFSLDKTPFRLKRKTERFVPNKHYKVGNRRYIESIIPLNAGIKSKCLMVDSPTESFLIKDSIITHNSSLLTEYLVLYLAVYGKLPGFGEISVALAIFDSMDNGAKNLRNNIEHRYNNSSFLQKWIKSTRFTDNRLEFTNVEGKQFCIRLFGVLTGVRGFKEYGERPTIALIDDIFSTKAAESDTVTKDIEDTIYKAVMPALHPTRRKIIWVGTPMNKKDPLYKAAGTAAWNTLAFPSCEKFPCTKEEFVGAWEDRFSYEVIKAQYELYKDTGRIDAFNQELMLRILSDDDRLVLDEDIVWYKRNDVLDNKKDFNFYITTDFATSEKESADFSVISVWALDYKGVFHWVDGVVARQDMAKNVDDLFRLCKLYNPLSVGVEISGQQKGFVSWIKRDMQIRGHWFTLASDKVGKEEGLRPTTNKLTRFNAALPLFKQRLIAFPEELRESPTVTEFTEELFNITPSGSKSLHDDCLDSISQLQMLEYFNPYNPNEKSEEPVKRLPSKYFNNLPEIEETDSYII